MNTKSVTKTEELRPCPFCGTLPQANTWTLHGISETRYFCPNPECPHSVRTVTLEQWNTRPIEDNLIARIAELEQELNTTDGLLKEATETIGAVVACCTYNSNDDAKIGIYGIDQKAFTRIDQFMTHYNDAISAGKVSVDVKTSTDNNKRSKWKAYVPGWGAPAVNKRYLVKLINDWITIATYYLRVGGGYWKNDSGQELADGVVSLWKGLEE